MKYKTTAKEVRNGYCKQICIGYADLQFLLHYEEPVAYTCGVYGWNSDIYNLYHICGLDWCIVTGYRPFGNVKADYDYNHKMNEKARKICDNWDLSLEQKKNKMNKLLKELCEHYYKETYKHLKAKAGV